MPKPVIFIPVESKKRELDGKILLAATLLNRGFEVMLGTKSGIHREIAHYTNSLYLAKSASNVFLSFYKNFKSQGHHLAVLDVEGGALTREIRNDLLRSYQPEAAVFFDYFYVFGDKIKEAMVRDLPYISPEKVIVTGEPRFDLLRPEHDAFFREEMDKILQQYGRFILINTSFGLYNSTLGIDGIKNFLETTADIPDDQRHLYLLKHKECSLLLDAFISLAKEIAAAFPEINVVLRPHPDEDSLVYQNSFNGISNIHVNGSGNVHPWIKAAQAVIHHDCTTGMESVMAEKPTLSYIPREEESITAWLPVYLSIRCTTPEEIVNQLKRILGNGITRYYPGDEKAEVFGSYFENYRRTAADKLAGHLASAYQNMNSVFTPSLSLWLKRFRSRINIVRLRRDKQFQGWERFISIDSAEVMQKLSRSGLYNSAKLPLYTVRGGNTIRLRNP